MNTTFLRICVYESQWYESVIKFLRKAFKDDGRVFDITKKESDLADINNNYMKKGCFWCLVNEYNKVFGTIAIRKLDDGTHELKRFFVSSKIQNLGYGTKLLNTVIYYSIQNNIKILKGAVLERGKTIQHIHNKLGFTPTSRYNNSSADIFYKLELSPKYTYEFLLNRLYFQYNNTLILNPTENIFWDNINYDKTTFMEGLYVSEIHKEESAKIIFGGRNEYIDFVYKIKEYWKRVLNAYDVDLKTLSGLNAHLILFLCILQPNDVVMLLPEVCGGHYSTEAILRKIGAEIVLMEPDYSNYCVNQKKTEDLIEKYQPKYIFVDRSEGLVYEDFSWLSKYKNSFKIFDASQYISHIITNEYIHPFDMGFDMILSTLHKNYPGPQKGIICVSKNSHIWESYLKESKTYISSTHPRNIATSILPLLDINAFKKYADISKECHIRLEKELIQYGLPIIQPQIGFQRTMHIWIKSVNNINIYNYYLKLEQLGILVNYRLLPYNLGHGLRIGITAAVRSGLRIAHIQSLAKIMARAYYEDISPSLIKDTARLIKNIKSLL